MATKHDERVELPSPAPGTQRHLRVVRYGSADARPKVYMQAALHANELPGALALHVLESLLDELDAADAIRGHIVLVPFANPIGLAQMVQGAHVGRAELHSGKNFNRYYPALTDDVAPLLDGQLGNDAAANTTRIRAALSQAIAARPVLSCCWQTRPGEVDETEVNKGIAAKGVAYTVRQYDGAATQPSTAHRLPFTA